MRKQNATNGIYYPSCFTINLPRFSFPDECKVGKVGFRTFIHEHTHYIQDISTLNGMCRIDWFLMSICALSRITCNCDPIHIPYDRKENLSNPETRETVQAAIDAIGSAISWSKNTEGRSGFSIVNKSICRIENIHKGGRHITLECEDTLHPLVYFDIVDTTGMIHQFNFGAAVIEEGMAYAVERLISKDVPVGLPDIPYKVSECLAKTIIGDVIDPENMILFSDISLQTDVPGLTFLDLCQTYGKDKSFMCSPFEDRVSILAKFLDKEHNLDDLFCRVHGDFVETMNEFGDTVPELQAALYWLCETTNKAYELRKDDPAAFIRLYIKSGDPSKIEYSDSFPMPLIIDKDSVPYSQGNYDEHVHALMFLALQSIHNSMTTSDGFGCMMYEWCNMPIKDRECAISSYNKCNRYPHSTFTCHLGISATRLGFYGKTVLM